MEHIAPLAAELSGEFYADPEMMRQALQQGRMFNLIHHASSYKFDIYPCPASHTIRRNSPGEPPRSFL